MCLTIKTLTFWHLRKHHIFPLVKHRRQLKFRFRHHLFGFFLHRHLSLSLHITEINQKTTVTDRNSRVEWTQWASHSLSSVIRRGGPLQSSIRQTLSQGQLATRRLQPESPIRKRKMEGEEDECMC